MRTRQTLLLASIAAPVFACGGAPPPEPVMTMPPLFITAKAPPAPRARWMFAHPDQGLVAKVDVGDGSTLYVGAHGRRVLGKGTEPLRSADTLAFDDLVGVLKDDKGQFVFVADDGDTFVSSETLGPLPSATHPGPLVDPTKNGPTRLISPTTGKASILAILPTDHSVVRSSDYGATWKPVDYQGANKAYGHAVSVALDSKGNGLLLHYPQRLFVTHDDGATWSPVASPGIGGWAVRRDGADRVFLYGYRGARAMLDGGSLAKTTDDPTPVYKAATVATATPASDEQIESAILPAGDHVVEFQLVARAGKTREVRVVSAKLGDPLDKAVSVPELLGKEGFRFHVGGYGNDLIYLRQDDDADAESPTATVFFSHDFGATWQKDVTLQGSTPLTDDDDDEVGPKGWAYVASLCKNPYGYDGYAPHRSADGEEPSGNGTDCQNRQIRPAGATAFEDMTFNESFSPRRFAFDEAHDKVYVIGNHEGTYAIYESLLSQNKFLRTKFMEGEVNGDTQITVDPSGGLRGFDYEPSNRAWAMYSRDAAGKSLPTRYLAVDPGAVTFAGPRGLLITHDKAWETADAGDTFMRVATSGASAMLCSDAGCLQRAAQRIGWELPAVQDQERVALQTNPPNKDKVAPPPAPGNRFPNLELSCKPSGPQTKVAQTPDTSLVDVNAGDVRWASTRSEQDGRVTLVVGGKSAVREIPLLAALPKPGPKDTAERRSGYRALNDGVVAARYSFAPAKEGPPNPVDVDLTWWVAATGKTFHHALPKVKAFRVSRYGLSGEPQIVDGGLLYQTSPGEPVSFIHEDGKVDTMTLPDNTSIRQADRFGKRWLLADPYGAESQISWSDDKAATWQHKVWGLDESGTAALASVAGKPNLAVAHHGGGKLLFTVDTNVPDDPPAPVVVETSPADVACEAQRGKQRFSLYLPGDQRTVHARVESGSAKEPVVVNLSASNRIVHDTASGTTCTAAYVLSGHDPQSSYETAYLYLEGKSWSGWRFFRVNDTKDTHKTTLVAEPLTCK